MARGYNHIFGLDYYESFSHVAKTATMRVFLAIGGSKQWQIDQIDVNNAQVHGHVEEELYLVPLEGYSKAEKGKVCRLVKSMYALK